METLRIQSVVCETNGKTEVHNTWRDLVKALREVTPRDLIVVNYFDGQHNPREAHGVLSSKQGKHYIKAEKGQSGCINLGPRGSGMQIVYEVD